jgi:hypothetical protein
MAKKQMLTVSLYIPPELGLSSEDLERLNNVFQIELTDIVHARVAEAPPFMPLNTKNPHMQDAPVKRSRRKTGAAKSGKKTGKGSAK